LNCDIVKLNWWFVLCSFVGSCFVWTITIICKKIFNIVTLIYRRKKAEKFGQAGINSMLATVSSSVFQGIPLVTALDRPDEKVSVFIKI
jgi:hypothetical protein